MDYKIFVLLIILFCIFALTVLYLTSTFNKERKDYINLIIAKNTPEYISLSNKDKPPVKRTLTDGEILGEDAFNGIVN